MLDDRDASSEWDFRTLVSCSGPDMNAVAKKVRETMIRVQDYELKELERAYRVNYFALAVEVLRRPCRSVLTKSSEIRRSYLRKSSLQLDLIWSSSSPFIFGGGQMKYFLMQTDPLYVDAPVLQDWRGRLTGLKSNPGFPISFQHGSSSIFTPMPIRPLRTL